MNMERLLKSVKEHEGYRNKVYLDTLGKRTVGVGHLCVEDFWEDDKEYEEDFLMDILKKDLQEENIKHTGNENYNFFMSYIIPESNLKISEFNIKSLLALFPKYVVVEDCALNT